MDDSHDLAKLSSFEKQETFTKKFSNLEKVHFNTIAINQPNVFLNFPKASS